MRVTGGVGVKEVRSLKGSGISPSLVANSILERSIRDNIPVTPMKLQKLLYLTSVVYQNRTGQRLLSEPFQAWKWGPVSRSIYDEFRSYGASPIQSYAVDSRGNSLVVAAGANDSSSAHILKAIDDTWNAFKYYTPAELVRITHGAGGAWESAWQDYDPDIDNDLIGKDYDILGLASRM